ncbi:hemicentin-2-like [Spodoptera frugiperda]|uniref:Hemolin n=1 Tax=Spodoptera frugiperda TaxID=7108 RepID=A0A9R0DR14_SPOFR|nr:hemicentin-2-like [Spodoptera frugiperda]
MGGEIGQVREEVNIIFDKVLSSNASQIENFVLVTLNDPETVLRTVTKDPKEFKRAVDAIHLHSFGRPDCAEAAMAGINLALRSSMPHSYLYVFTDASANDYALYDQVTSLAHKMQSQIVFLLTGDCGDRSTPEYQVYHKVAEATSGQVFNMYKHELKDILKYIEESITGIGSKIVDTKFEPGYGKNLTYTVDSHTGDILVAITGDEPKIGNAIGPSGSRPYTEHIVSEKKEMAVAKVTGAMPGEHVVPVGKGNVHMGVKVLGTGVKLETVKILGMKGEVIEELKLELVDEKTQFYRTPSFSPPSTMFSVTINGYDIETKSPVTRKSSTPISRQDLSTEEKVETAPVVTIDGDSSITLYDDDPLELTCKVHAYPEPDIKWVDKESGNAILAETNIFELPYDYISILKIDKATKNATYECKANNRNGNDVKGVEVMAKRRFYFYIIESPKDIRIEYAKEGKLVCKVYAYPSATINWYKDAKPLSSSSRIEISKDQTVVTLKDMQPGMEGKFMCEARNDKERKVFYSNVEIFGVEKPVIDKTINEIRVTEKTNGELSCRILKGIPKPTIVWSFLGSGTKMYLKQTGETIQLKNAHRGQSGLYTCTAKNVLGSDNHNTELIVEYPPRIKSDVKEMKILDGDIAKLPCDVDGVPAPTVYWTFNGINVTSTWRTQITTDYSLIIKTTVADTGHYVCHADNKIGKDERKIILKIHQKPVIDKSVAEIRVREKSYGKLSCRILKGIPKPTIIWSFRGSGTKKYLKQTGETIQLNKWDTLQTEIEILSDEPPVEEVPAERVQFDNDYYPLVARAKSLLAAGRKDSESAAEFSDAESGGRVESDTTEGVNTTVSENENSNISSDIQPERANHHTDQKAFQLLQQCAQPPQPETDSYIAFGQYISTELRKYDADRLERIFGIASFQKWIGLKRSTIHAPRSWIADRGIDGSFGVDPAIKIHMFCEYKLYIPDGARRQSYSLHKFQNLLKPFLIVSTDGYIIDVKGPYPATKTDANIMSSIMNDYENPIHVLLEPNDVFILDRGFRDSLGDIEACGYEYHVPPSKDREESQLTTAQANESRKVTMCAEEIRRKIDTPNILYNYVETKRLNNRRADFVRLEANDVQFPQYTEEQVILLALGTYQVKLARSYCSEHLQNGVYTIEVYRQNALEIRRLA